jgi:hypothetical protein
LTRGRFVTIHTHSIGWTDGFTETTIITVSGINPNTHCGLEIRRFGFFFVPIDGNAFGAE